MSDWYSPLVDKSPTTAVVLAVAGCAYKIIKDWPLWLAVFFGVVSRDKEVREDARKMAEILSQRQDDGQPAIEGPNQRPPRWWRRKRRRRRR